MLNNNLKANVTYAIWIYSGDLYNFFNISRGSAKLSQFYVLLDWWIWETKQIYKQFLRIDLKSKEF